MSILYPKRSSLVFFCVLLPIVSLALARQIGFNVSGLIITGISALVISLFCYVAVSHVDDPLGVTFSAYLSLPKLCQQGVIVGGSIAAILFAVWLETQQGNLLFWSMIMGFVTLLLWLIVPAKYSSYKE